MTLLLSAACVDPKCPESWALGCDESPCTAFLDPQDADEVWNQTQALGHAETYGWTLDPDLCPDHAREEAA